NPSSGEYDGILIESSATNLLLNSETLSTQSVTILDATQYVFSFYGTGSVDVTDAAVANLVGVSTYNRVQLAFTSTSTNITFTVTGDVKYAQLETGTTPTSWIK